MSAFRLPRSAFGPCLALAIGCRGAVPGDSVARSDSAVTARTWGLAYLQQNQLPKAEAEFRKVVGLAPDQALGYANLGLVYLREGRYRDAESQLAKARALDSTNADVGMMLARVYAETGREAAARREIERVLQRDSTDIRALYALAQLPGEPREGLLRRILARAPVNLVTRLDLIDLLLARGAADAAAAELETLQRQLPQLPREAARYFDASLRAARAGAGVGAGRVSEAAVQAARFHRAMEVTAAYQVSLQHLGGAGGAGGALVGYPVLTFSPNLAVPTEDARAVAAGIRFTDVTEGSGLEGVEALPDSVAASLERAVALAAGDYDDDEAEDLYVGGHLFRGTLGRFVETTDGAGVELRDRATAAAFGDFDNDGRLDLYVARRGGASLFRNLGDGKFRDVAASAGLADSGAATAARFVDLDHDGDLDLLLATPAGTRAYRNNLDGTFREMATQMGLAVEHSRDATFGDFDGDGRVDIVVVGTDGRLRLFHNLGQGHFEDVTAASGLAGAEHAAAVAVGDYDNDGFLDLFVTSLAGPGPVLYHNRGDGTFEIDARTRALRRALSGVAGLDAVFFDFDNDGWLDLLVVGRPGPARLTPGRRPGGVFLFRNDRTRGFEDVSSILPTDLRAGRAVAVADFDQDGDLDLIVVGSDGKPRLLRNDGGNVSQYVDVRLAALRQGSGKNNTFGYGATLELRARDLYQLRLVTDRVTHFGLGRRLKADVLRVGWPNGVSQTVYYPGTEEDVLEQQLLKGSCPFLYVWGGDGRGFTFATDVMWNSALGMPLGIMTREGGIMSASPRASQEYLRIPSGLLQPRDGRYELRLTEELWETGYLDEVRLLAVDHPDSVQMYLNERFTPAGVSALRLYPVARPRPPVAATDERGNDLLPALRAQDFVFAATLVPARYQGLTEPHDLVLDFGALAGMDSVFLFLTGWIYPTDASINFALAQSQALHVVPLQLQVRDVAGEWRTVIPDLGFPAGKNKTIIVDLTGKFLSNDTRVRIRTNMEIYWDRAFVAATASASPVAVTRLPLITADLRYRGFSRMYRKGGRYGPQWYDYNDVSRDAAWAPIPGALTRYGDVLPLLRSSDDMYAIFGPGDEIALQFDTAGAPPLPTGWTRDFVLYSDAWLKDADLNTSGGGTVEPLPFHAMSRYPYGGDEAFPTDAGHRRFVETYNTRRVGRGRGR
ncbi:MAG TPA: FG-GAP-like repeat-containing protein [Gemmatimonadales bacterium]|nr:FG-GAP-like repeat-containing protein [Gemmatimonadales bacterium]